MAEQQHLRAALTCRPDSPHHVGLHAPRVAVEHQDTHAAQLDEPLRLVAAAVVAVPGHALHGQHGKRLPPLLQIPLAVAQMQYIAGVYLLHRLYQFVHFPMGVGYHQNIHRPLTLDVMKGILPQSG